MHVYVKAGIIGVGGFVLAFGGWHLWIDHQNLHALVELEGQRQAAFRAQQGQNLPAGQNPQAPSAPAVASPTETQEPVKPAKIHLRPPKDAGPKTDTKGGG